MSKTILKGYIIIPDNVSEQNYQAICKELENHKQLTLAETGCITFEVKPCDDYERKFIVYEEFTDKEAFNAHQQRVKNSYWGEISAEVERHYQLEQ